nr:hypothetical protein [Tanacetum cinerariifolium]
MDANKKIDLEHVQCPPKSKILTNIIKNHPLRFSIAASSSVSWIYMAQCWHTLKEDGLKYRLKFMLDMKELSLTLDDFRTIFHLPQATDNNHDSFVPPLSFSDMIPFYNNHLGLTMELETPSSFKTTGLLQPWQMLCNIFSKCLTTRVTGWDQPPLRIIQMLYWFINNIYVDYAELLKEGIHYSLLHSTSSIPYPRFTKIIIGHYMTNFPEISRRARDKYHNLKDDDLMKNIFNSGRYKDKVGLKIPDRMVTKVMKQTKHYRIDVPLIQSNLIKSTQGTHRTPSAPRSPNPKADAAESSALTRSTMIRLCFPQRRSICLTPPAPVPTVDKADELILQDTLQVSLAEHKSRQEQEAKENMVLVDEYLASVEIEKMVRAQSDKESPEVKFTDVVIPVNVYDEEEEEDEITDEVYELKRKEKWKNGKESRITPFPTPIRSPRIYTDLVYSDIEKLQKLMELQGRYGYLFEHLRAKFMPRKSFVTLADHLHEAIADSLPTMVDKHVKEQVKQQVPETPVVRPRDQDDPHDDAHPEGENSAKRQKTSEYEAYEILVSPHPRKTTPLVLSCQRDPEASTLSLINQDHLYLKKGSSGPEKIVLSLHKFPAVVFNDDDIEEQTSIWVNKYVKKFNPYARYEFEMFSVIYEPVHGITYKNNKKEKRVMRHSEIHKFCDAILNRVLEGLKSYNNDVRYGYIQKEQTKDEVEYLKLFEEEIED